METTFIKRAGFKLRRKKGWGLLSYHLLVRRMITIVIKLKRSGLEIDRDESRIGALITREVNLPAEEESKWQ